MDLNINNLVDNLERNKEDGSFQYKGLLFSYDDFEIVEGENLITVKFFIESKETSKLNIFK